MRYNLNEPNGSERKTSEKRVKIQRRSSKKSSEERAKIGGELPGRGG